MKAPKAQWTVQPRYGLLRRVLLPAYSRDRLYFFAALAVVVVVLFAVFDAQLAAQMSFAGYVGALIMAEGSTPSSLLLPIDYEGRVTRFLDEAQNLKRTGNGLEWINTRGRLFRWDTDILRVECSREGILVSGSRVDLGLIAEEMRSQ